MIGVVPAETFGQAKRKRKSHLCDDHHRFENSARLKLPRDGRHRELCTTPIRECNTPAANYMQRLRDHRMLSSISRPANPFDNATCESFLKTIKREETHAAVYRDFEDVHNRILEFIEQYYNRCRLHSALGYRSPERFEREIGESASGSVCAAPIMTFCGT